MKRQLRDRWVAALRSGNYAQGKGLLCKVTDDGAEYCCLGVLHEVEHGEGAWVEEFDGRLRGVDGRVASYLGPLGRGTASALIRMNDTQGKSFSEIADWIEQNVPIDEQTEEA